MNSRMLDIHEAVIECRACERLVKWREQIAIEKRRAFREDEYWGRPVPGFGDPEAAILVLGLAPGAHGANRTGRVFTGDRSGDWLFAALYRAGFASQQSSTHRGDGLTLSGVYITAAVKCAPPGNLPTTGERDLCRGFLLQEVDRLEKVRVVLCLGGFAWQQAMDLIASRGVQIPRPRPRFGHEAQATLGGLTLIGSYHPSQQNTFTGRLTEPMLDSVLSKCKAVCEDQERAVGGR